ncbi:MAG TPA: type VI secretion system tip protein TssI/VgrG [Myxococcota bacterium]|nr:type VI secretion system tip protein TssI/VgrG [Myxococcota bacterium]
MAYTQKERMCSMTSPLGDDALLVERMRAREAVSSLFAFELDLLAETDDIGFDQIVGKSVTVSVELQNRKQRHFNGIVSRFSAGASQGRFSAYRAEVVPALWLLTRRVGCRIFQHLSVPDIAKKLFGELGVSDVKLELQKSYPAREYCVQYRESDFNFVSRLFEDVGISYYFAHDTKSHTLVLFDTPGGNPPCPGQETAIYASASGEGVAGDVSEWAIERELRPGKFSHTDYNFEQPSLSLHTTTPTSLAIAGNERFEIYEHSGDFMEPSHGESRVKVRMEAEESASLEARGVSRCAAFTPGYRFDLRGHHRKDSNDAYVITQLLHTVVDSIGPGAQGASYDNAFVCRPHKVPIRPLRSTPKPLVYGVQTATVVGAAGKEIDVDPHARVVVQFHWDREGKRDENSSCRVRVAQNSAGKGWGLIAHPRIGQEVVVEFIDGDPDRPIVVGMVYNGEQTPPYGLPGNSTQTGLKSRSSPGGGGFNEIRLEDKAGSEHMYVQAQKDRTTLTKNDDSQSVGHDRTRSVTNDESVSVGANQKIAVTADRTRTVGGNESVSVTGNRTKSISGDEGVTIGGGYTQSVTGGRTRTVSGAETVTVALARTHSVGINEAISVGAAQEVTVGAARALTVGGGQTTTIGVNHTVNVGAKESISVGADRSLEVGAKHNVKVGADEGVSVGGKQTIEVTGNRALKVGGDLADDVTGDAILKSGKKIAIGAADEIMLEVGSAKIIMKSNGDITIQGKQIDVKGSGNVVLKGQKILGN